VTSEVILPLIDKYYNEIYKFLTNYYSSFSGVFANQVKFTDLA